MKIFNYILKILGWHIEGSENLSKKSVVTVAPHTSFRDGFIGYIVMRVLNVKFSVVSAEWLFFFPMNLIMKYILHANPCGKNSVNCIINSASILENNDDIHLIICPEGHLRKMTVWPKGFYFIAKKANVPIDIVVLNYKTKTVHICEPVSSDLEYDDVLDKMVEQYKKYAYGYYPYKFALPK